MTGSIPGIVVTPELLRSFAEERGAVAGRRQGVLSRIRREAGRDLPRPRLPRRLSGRGVSLRRHRADSRHGAKLCAGRLEAVCPGDRILPPRRILLLRRRPRHRAGGPGESRRRAGAPGRPRRPGLCRGEVDPRGDVHAGARPQLMGREALRRRRRTRSRGRSSCASSST